MPDSGPFMPVLGILFILLCLMAGLLLAAVVFPVWFDLMTILNHWADGLIEPSAESAPCE